MRISRSTIALVAACILCALAGAASVGISANANSGIKALWPRVAVSSSYSQTPPQCKRLKPESSARTACIKHANRPGSSCVHPVKAGIAFDHQKNETGAELTDKLVEFPPGGEGTPPPGWVNYVMGPAATAVRTNLSYATIGYKLKTSIVALCRAALYESLPGFFHMHEIHLPNRTQASYNIELVGGYAYGLTLYERYLRK